MGEKTVLALSHPNKASLRTTVPMFIVKQWQLSKGQNLDWSLELHNGELVAIVRKDGGGKVDKQQQLLLRGELLPLKRSDKMISK